MGYISSKDLGGKGALTGPARQKDIDRRRIIELEEQLKIEKEKKKDGSKSRVAKSTTSESSGGDSKKDTKSVGNRKSTPKKR